MKVIDWDIAYIPDYAIPYLMGADDVPSYDSEEDAKNILEYEEKLNEWKESKNAYSWEIELMEDEATHFVHRPAFGLGAMCHECKIILLGE